MISQKQFKILEYLSKFIKIFAAVPILWDAKRGQLYTTRSLKVHHYFTFFLQLIQLVVVGINLVKCRYVDKAPYGEQAFLFIVFTTVAYAFTVSYPFVSQPEFLVVAQNACFRYALEFQDKFMPSLDTKVHLRNRIWDSAMIAYSVLTFLVALVGSAHIYVYPRSPLYLFSLVPSSTNIYLKTIIFIINSVAFFKCCVSLLLLCVVCSHFAATFFILHYIQCKEFNVGRLVNRETSDILRTFHVFPCRYRVVQLLIKYFVEIYGNILIPTQFIIAQSIICGNYTLFRYWNEVNVVVRVFVVDVNISTVTAWFIIISWSGICYKTSAKTVHSWKNFEFKSSYERKIIKKFCRSCKPIALGCMGYTMTSVTALKFLLSLIRGTFRTVLTLR
ncbi:unnamed protein product [Orchesella dallaii]|uniref:Odorant receptor n=1 Tax=Orchesella dallaii TaxID=48710 RepID=A0ABP1S1B4_9HEXA